MTTAAELTPRDECLYYLVREMGDLGCRAKDQYFYDMLEHFKRDGFLGMTRLGLHAFILSGIRRDRLAEVHAAIEAREERLLGGVREELDAT